MKRLWLASAALIAILPVTALAQAVPPPARGAAQAQQQRQQQPAPAPKEEPDFFAEDVKAGRLTPAQADQLRRSAEATQQRIEAAHADLKVALKREFERDGIGALQNQADRTLNAALRLSEEGFGAESLEKGDFEASGHFARDGSEFLVGLYEATVEADRIVMRSDAVLKYEKQFLQEVQNFMRERAEMIRSNPNASQNDRLQADFEARTLDRYARTIETRRAEKLRELDRQSQKLRDAKEKVEFEFGRMVAQYGPNLKDWPPPGTPAPRPPRTAAPAPAAPLPPPAPVTPSPPDLGAAPALSAGTAPVRTVKKGVVPGANGDPFAGFRVPSNLGGTGAPTDTPPPPRLAAPPLPPPPAMDQAEANALRTERLRQQAMQNASDLNDQLDRQWRGDPDPADRVDDFEFGDRSERMIPLQIRPHPGGGGAGGGEGFGGLESQLADGSGFVEDWGTLRPDWPDWPADSALNAGSAFDEMLAEYRAIEAETVAIIDSWRSFELGGTLTVAELLPIYAGWDPMTAPIGSSGRSLSAAGTSPSAAGTSLSAAGTSLSSAGTSLSAAGTSLSSMGMSLSAAGSAIPSLWPYTPSAAPQGYAPNWGAGFSPTDPFRVSNATGPAQFRLPPGADPGPSLCGR